MRFLKDTSSMQKLSRPDVNNVENTLEDVCAYARQFNLTLPVELRNVDNAGNIISRKAAGSHDEQSIIFYSNTNALSLKNSTSSPKRNWWARLLDRFPLPIDALRQLINTIFRYRPHAAHTARWSGPAKESKSASHPSPVIVIAMNWLNVGGAEAFAIDSAKLAKSLGYRVVVVCDKHGPLAWINKIEAFSESIHILGALDLPTRLAVYARMISDLEPKTIHIHHNLTFYKILPSLRNDGFSGVVMDTTHIVENRHGGAVEKSLKYSPWIDIHHVISKRLGKLYIEAGVPKEKIRLGYLSQGKRLRKKAPPYPACRALRIGFVGRLTQQKRPYLFVELAKRLNARSPGSFSFEMIGEGLLSEPIRRQIDKNAIPITTHPAQSNVADFLLDTDILVICSDQEGLTLAAFEAVMNDCLVISSAVGSQDELIAPPMLLSVAPYRFMREAESLIMQIKAGDVELEGEKRFQRERYATICAQPHAIDACAPVYRSSQHE